MNMVGTVELILLAQLAFLLVASAVVSAVAMPLARRVEAWAPRARHRAIWAVLLSPLAVSLCATGAALLPSFLALCFGAADHCAVDADHPHLCLLHHSAPVGSVGTLLLVTAAVWGSARLARFWLRHTRAARLVRSLLAMSSFDGARRLWRAPLREPLCLSAGLWRVQIVVSEGLLAQTSTLELEFILRHERAHQRRRDALLALIARAASVFILPAQRRALIAQLELAAEQVCDEDSAPEPEDRLVVAELLLKLERCLADFAARPLVVSIGSSSVPARIESLLAEPRRGGGSGRVSFVGLGAAATILGGYEHIHHLAERLLAGLGH